MSDPATRISRRKLLQMSALAPLVALAASGASEERIGAAAVELADIPDGVMTELKGRAYAKDPKYNPPRFVEKVAIMWTYFKLGATRAGKAPPDKTQEADMKALLLAAYDKPNQQQQKSGDLIVERLPNWELKEEITNVCAFRCGEYAAKAALDMEQQKITPAAYAQAFNRTEREMFHVMTRLRNVQKIQGVELFAGNGC